MSTGLLSALPAAPPNHTDWPWTTEYNATTYATRGQWPRITLVTPSYNQGRFLEETIRSVLLQNYPNLQYIIIDGGSTDESVAIIRKYERWIDHWVSEPDGGQSHAINKGLQRAGGEWFNWLNSDDFLLPGALHALASATLDPSEPVCVSGETINLRDGEYFGPYRANIGDDTADGVFGLRANQPGSLLRLNAVRAIGGLRADLRYVMDFELWLRLRLSHGATAFRSRADRVAVYRYHPTSKTCSESDIFAGEQLSILTRLAESRGVQFPRSLAPLISESPRDERPFPIVSDSQLQRSATEAAWLRRTVILDSLLFRALRQRHRDDLTVMAEFERLLRDIEPLLSRHYPADAPAVMGRALLHAMETLGRFAPRNALHSLALNPGWRQLRGLGALAARSLRL